MSRPAAGEYAPHFDPYIQLVQEDNIPAIIEKYTPLIAAFYNSLPEDKANHAYSDGKWTVKEVIQHIIDAERIFAYRLLRIARNDKTPLPGFDENAFARNARVTGRSLQSLKDELQAVRTSTGFLLRSLNEEELQHKGTASGYPITANTFAFIIYGHLLHHQRILTERYL
ncbi:DinB family protein [Filimonas effusa]|uniref:DinB family protein n=1 Tax=Filimonas effusa TaxID=2508721 RepID=A0A4Q1DB69_9BACT|nr:DinB family protein [Filimonas effusa]RXK86694.1 DinB family protein [Filimonas effusa]